MSVVKLEGGPEVSVKPGQKSWYEIKWDYHIVGTMA
jgi:hypothetical protein